MKGLNVLAAVLVVAGIAGLVYGSFTYTKETHEGNMGPIEMSITEKETVNVPVWLGVAGIVAGGVLLFAGSRKT